MTMRSIMLTALVALLAVGFIGYMWMQNAPGPDLASFVPTSTPEETLPQTATSSVLIALLDPEQISNGISRGCDKVVLVSQPVPTTTMPLSAALGVLFNISTTSVSGWLNFMARTNTTLHFDHAAVSDGTAKIYLTGSLSGLAGECDDPRAQIQIEETAKQFSNVQNVGLYLNNQLVTSLALSLK